MFGSIAGDIIGSVYEHHAIKTKDFRLFSPDCRFTDDTVLTVAVAKAILDGGEYLKAVHQLARLYPNAGYGGSFRSWLRDVNPRPYNSWGNGSAMRVSPVGWAFDSVADVLREAGFSAEITHNHPEGIKGAQATALAVLMARTTRDKEQMRSEIETRFGYNLQRTVDDIRPDYDFDISCQGTVPEAIIAFLDSTSYEDTIRNAISLGGDSDTLACIAGGIAEAYYGPLPHLIVRQVTAMLPLEFSEIIDAFCAKFGVPSERHKTLFRLEGGQ
jgi:ADP-ribosylglycohydrolase